MVFVGFQDRVSLTMVTLDTSGLLCVWPYGPDSFSGFGWYTPSKVRRKCLCKHEQLLTTLEPSTAWPSVLPSELAARPDVGTSMMPGAIRSRTQEVLVDVTLHTYKLETKRAAGRVGRGGAVGGDAPAYIFNRALPPVRRLDRVEFAI